ncbi:MULTISPECIES: tRNA-uridine aminocarboxypropyltransferase [Pseudoalteromonas]|uniref:tRNA-uridine aminocarboxypropyltransferase n=1 Tax=Pseudoalteromonas TaxID=53246 RepID=UPI000F76BEDD|nr:MULTISPECIES: tRNA-uridine aminocarboxypropyltransferase [Pseudoalteromonas]MCG7564510.1 DTW domain-containing protein [Pseudoalteromonas sp. McH1-42]MEC4087129.1 tRNA-uridine aminocarboxypropyltransferase [Pseudoalteromonas rubra]
MKRAFCDHCHFPLRTCVCPFLGSLIHNRCKIVVLQHPSEVKVAKNTVRLLSLQLSNIEVVQGESEADFSDIRSRLKSQVCALLYPSENAMTLDETRVQQEQPNIETLVVLDGTWKKVHKMLMLNPWLMSLSHVSFANLPENQYHIRKAEQAFSLSTLEATAHFLHLYEQISPAPFYQALAGMIEQQTRHMPDHVKLRYLSDE